jgi:hypothetical protein
MVGMAIVVIFWAFAGLNPSMDTMKSNMGFFTVIISYMSPFKWSSMRMVRQLR